MVDPRSARFWQIATRCGLIVPSQLEECWNAIPADKRTSEAIDRRLARQAVNSGMLTLWQAQQILAGRQQGLRIDRYTLLDQIGQGGMGRVYLALDTRLSRHVALKVLSRERMSNPRALARFRREAKVGAQLQHENLIRIYDEGDIQGMPYLVMEYITGQTVSQMIADQGRIEPAMAAELGRQVALGLDHLHQKGLLHRDVNPTNVMIDRGGTAKLTDLGLAIDLGDAEDVVTRDGATVGTFDYISPEQARNPRQIDTRSDIYSLGCTLYHMLSGRVPFPAPSLPEKLFAHQSKEAEPLVGQVSGLPEGLDAVVRKMMSKKPDERYFRPSLVARALEPYAQSTRFAFEEPSTPRQTTSPTPQPQAADAVRVGSDPDLAILPSSTNSAATGSPSDPFEFVKIDLGPEIAISDSLSSARSRSRESKAISLESPWLWVVASVVVGVIIAVLVMTSRGGNEPSTASSTQQKQSPAPPAAVPPSQITVEYEDGTAIAATNLQDAVRRASGKPARVVIRDGEPLRLGSTTATQLRVGGRVTIQAAEGAHPLIEVSLTSADAAVRVLNANASLTLQGLAFVAERKLPDVNLIPTVIDTVGNLKIEHCSFLLKGTDHHARAVFARGIHTQAILCFIHGFDTPLELISYQNSNARLEQCMLVAPYDSPASTGSLTGWAVRLRVEMSRPSSTRRLTIDRCTIVGAGLTRLEGNLEQSPLKLEVSNTVVVGQALALWPNAPFPGSMTWLGHENAYELSGDSWILPAPDCKTLNETQPGNLESWAKTPGVTDAKSHEQILKFAVQPTGAGQSPSDYKLVDLPDPKPGADPGLVAAPPR
jgi:serine/threonine protein kinase